MKRVRDEKLAFGRAATDTVTSPAMPDKPSTSDAATTTGQVPDDKYYFESYSHLDIHEEMIRDRSRTETYRRAMMRNPGDFKDSVVLDIGCGTGILSIFAANAGAKHVYAVDACDVVDAAQSLVSHNNLAEKITLIKGKIEDITLPVDKVDIIISEWMGYFLVYESMLQSVLFARDKWLKSDGKLFPSHAHIWLSPFSNDSFYKDRVKFWGKMYGIDFSPLQVHAKKTVFLEPQVESVPTEDQYDEIKTFTMSLDTKTIRECNMHGIMGYFSVDFVGKDTTLTLSTSPSSGSTHWYQTLFFFEEPVPVSLDTAVQATLHVTPLETNPRFIKVSLQCSVADYTVHRSYEFK